MKIRAYSASVDNPLWGETVMALAECDLKWFFATRADGFATEAWDGQVLRDWEWIWAFGPSVELRWRTDEGSAWAAIAWELPKDPELPLGGEDIPEASEYELVEEGRLRRRLWGTARDGVFLEGRFRPTLPYPVSAPDGTAAVIELEEYVHRGAVAWTRAVGLTFEETNG